MSIPNYVTALANHKGAARVSVNGMTVPVKIMDINHEESLNHTETTFKCMVVNQNQITEACENLARQAKQALNSFYGANTSDYVRQAMEKAKAGVKALSESMRKPVDPFEIKKVYFNNPVTVVIWADGTKTIVRCQEGDIYSKETGLALCIAKKALGNKSNFNDVFHKWIPEEDETVTIEKPEVLGGSQDA